MAAEAKLEELEALCFHGDDRRRERGRERERESDEDDERTHT